MNIFKHRTLVLLFALMAPFAAALGGQPADPLAGAFFPPELVFQAREQIGMNPEQLQALRSRIESTQPRFDELRQRLERESAALAELARQDRPDEAALNAQLDKVLDAEREVKHLQVSLLAAIKSLLTPAQQAQLRELTKAGGTRLADATRQRLTEKVERIKAGMKNWAESGHDPSAIGKAMEQKVKPLLDEGKAIEAEAELDRILEQLKQETK